MSRLDQFCEAAVREIGGKFIPGGFLSLPEIRFTLSGHPGDVSFSRTALLNWGVPRSDTHVSRIAVHVRGRLPGRLFVRQRAVMGRWSAPVGTREFPTGHSRFDGLWSVFADDLLVPRRMFDGDSGDRLTSAIAALGPFVSPSVTLDHGSVVVRVGQLPDSSAQLIRLYDVAKQLCERLSEIESGGPRE